MRTRTYSAAGGVVIRQGRMLLLDRPSRGEIRLPKGHIEPGESPVETALREVGEEAGLGDLAVVADLGEQTVEFEYEGAHVRRTEFYYLMRVQSDAGYDQFAKDMLDFRPLWVPVEEATELLTYAAEKAVARRAIAAYAPLQDSF
jgi:8-oxo-dGTP pyrophosphatase MutT (NUDIX family)